MQDVEVADATQAVGQPLEVGLEPLRPARVHEPSEEASWLRSRRVVVRNRCTPSTSNHPREADSPGPDRAPVSASRMAIAAGSPGATFAAPTRPGGRGGEETIALPTAVHPSALSHPTRGCRIPHGGDPPPLRLTFATHVPLGTRATIPSGGLPSFLERDVEDVVRARLDLELQGARLRSVILPGHRGSCARASSPRLGGHGGEVALDGDGVFADDRAILRAVGVEDVTSRRLPSMLCPCCLPPPGGR